MADHPALTKDEIESIRARIGRETARQVAADLGLHPATVRRHTRGMKRADVDPWRPECLRPERGG